MAVQLKQQIQTQSAVKAGTFKDSGILCRGQWFKGKPCGWGK